ncbi:MAG: hypothetical protein Q7U64_01185, partial [Desulfocapsaceae bacterium]|nr:hypothetical protein [Desulfocapsaceae bacterium]
AIPDAGYKVAAWSGTDDDSLTTINNHITMDSDKTVAVQFAMISVVEYNLITSVTGGHGSLSPSSGNNEEGTVVDLTAIPDAGYKVAAWSGTDDDSLTTINNHITMDSDKTVAVQFEMISVVVKFPWAMFLPAIIGTK